MSPPIPFILVFACLVAAVWLGRIGRRHLPDDHLSADSKDAVKLAMGLVATMTALLLGLLVSSAKDSFDTQRSVVIEMAAKLGLADRAFVLYGPGAADAHTQFRLAIEDGVHQIWPSDTSRSALLTPNVATGDALYSALHRLSPQDELQRSLKVQLITLATEIGQLRALLLAQSAPSVATPLLGMVVCWLAIIFLAFSLLAPPNATTT